MVVLLRCRVGVAAGPLPAPAAAGASCDTTTAVSVAPDTGLDRTFQNYGNAGTGTSWTGGDGTESVQLPDGRELWLFDDSLLGTVRNGERTFAKAPFLHNALVVQQAGVLTRTYYTVQSTRPTAYISPRKAHRFDYAFWPDAAVVLNATTLQIIGNEQLFHTDGTHTQLPGVFVATLALPSLRRVSFEELPASVGASLGIGGTLTQGGFTYIYVAPSQGAVDVARVSGTDLTVAVVVLERQRLVARRGPRGGRGPPRLRQPLRRVARRRHVHLRGTRRPRFQRDRRIPGMHPRRLLSGPPGTCTPRPSRPNTRPPTAS